MSDQAALATADAWVDRTAEFGGVVGPRDAAEACAKRLAETTGRRVEQRFAERLFRLDAVIDPPKPEGGVRAARTDDEDAAVAWFSAFVTETGVTPGRDHRREVQARIRDGRLWFWEVDGRPATFLGTSVSVAGVSRIGPVYTPPEQRGRGYARALVATVSRARLEAGDTATCLFTDLANPVSNAIYQQVGYRAVGDFAQLTLVGG
jgi:predicted GNAT family acetyltransferase